MIRRLVLAAFLLPLLWAVLAAGYVLWLRYQGEIPSLTQLTYGDLWMNWLKWPTLLLLGVLGVGSAYAYDAQREAQQQERRAAAEQLRQQQKAEMDRTAELARQRFAAQVVGVQWLDPLQRRDYPTEWQLLWTLGLAKPNADDDVVPKNPEKWSKVRPVAGIAFNFGKATFDGFYESYINKLFLTLRERYFMSPHYFYSVAEGRKPWREVAGVHVELSLPAGLDAAESAEFVKKTVVRQFSIGKPNHSTAATPPDIHLAQGGSAVGFASLAAALDYLAEHPAETAWVLAFDAPSFPLDTQMNETATLLVLAGPALATGREPLAWVHRPSRVPIGQGGPAAAWKAALADAAARGQLAPEDVGYLIHDAGQGSDSASRRLGPLAQAVTETLPNKPFLDHSFNTSALLGDLNAGTALTNLALAIAYAHHRNTPVVVAGTRETLAGEAKAEDKAVTAVLVRPPAKPTPFDPAKPWFRARGEGNAYLPWWSRRHDAEPNRMQGWSD